MITVDFVHATLLPIEISETRLTAVSGYVSPSALAWFLTARSDSTGRCDEATIRGGRLDIVVGMAHHGGLTQPTHRMFQDLCRTSHGRLRVFYPTSQRAVHSKVLVWSDADGRPTRAFSGSANFTNAGLNLLGVDQENVMHEVETGPANRYVKDVLQDSISCTDPDIDDFIDFPTESSLEVSELSHKTSRDIEPTISNGVAASARFYLYYKIKGERRAYKSGGINWGHRGNRNRNEAQLAIESALSRSDFLPRRGTPFTVVCDDGATLILQGTSGSTETGKNLSSFPHNDALGAYLRSRMGLDSGQHVGLTELEAYGRGYVTLLRTEGEAFDYFLDFSSGPKDGVDWGDD